VKTGWQETLNEAGPGPDTHGRLLQLQQTHGAALYGLLAPWTHGDRQVAENLVRETLARASSNLDEFGADTSMLRPWLFTLARRVAIGFSQGGQGRATHLAARGGDEAGSVDAGAEQRPDPQVVARAINRISAEHRRVAVELYYRRRSVPETARILGVPEAVVRIQALGALRALRSAIGDGAAASPG
jgi:RNA polymerase sigma-70 factor (ECF subfamily)